MGKDIDDGGSAFPAEGGYDSGLYPDPGMSLRDYFAAKASAAMIINSTGMMRKHMGAVAEAAYAFADAMLAERAK